MNDECLSESISHELWCLLKKNWYEQCNITQSRFYIKISYHVAPTLLNNGNEFTPTFPVISFFHCRSFCSFPSSLHLPVSASPRSLLPRLSLSLSAGSQSRAPGIPHNLIVFWCSYETYKCTQQSQPTAYIFKTPPPPGDRKAAEVFTITAVNTVYTLTAALKHKSQNYVWAFPNPCLVGSWLMTKVSCTEKCTLPLCNCSRFYFILSYFTLPHRFTELL